MSSHPHPRPHGELVNENVHHEESDINVRAIVTFMVVLAVVAIVAHIAMWGLFALFNTVEDRTQADVSPLAAPPAQITDFPAPSLQTTPGSDLKKLRAEEAIHLHSYGWIDQGAGIGRIPIDRAKALLLERGLPVRPEPADSAEGTHVAATGESNGGRTLPAGGADRSSPPAPAGAQGASGATGATGAIATPQRGEAAPKSPQATKAGGGV
jgi:hypothetical protein